MSTSGFDLVTFGESMGSLRSAGPIRLGGAMTLTVGGAESNVAIGIARLGHSVRWVGRIGADEIGALVGRTLRAEGVDTGFVREDTRPTGLLLVENRIADISRVAYYRASSAGSALEIQDLDGAFDATTRVLHVTGITPALSETAAAATRWAVDAAADLGVVVSLDINYRTALWSRQQASQVLTRLAAKATVVFASDDELELVTDGAGEDAGATALLEAGVEQVVVKRGGEGASVRTRSEQLSAPARTVPVVDTIGAGDAFTAGYLSALLDGGDLAARLERGVTVGAFAVSGSGDWERLPTRDELPLLDRAAGSALR